MHVEFRIPGADALGRVFLAWTPVPAEARLVNPTGAAPVRVTLRSAGKARLLFSRKPTRLTKTLVLNLPASGAPVRFFVAGQFGFPSFRLGDAVIEARHATLGRLGKKALTVRVRKDAETLTPAERDRFLAAFATLNGGGAGRFRDFRDMHVSAALGESHGNVGFLPWHRAYLLDLERELQAIDPSVALHYWRFDRAAPKLFTREFMGVTGSNRSRGVRPRTPVRHLAHGRGARDSADHGFLAGNAPLGLLTEADTINLGSPGPNGLVRELRQHGGQPPRQRAHELLRLHPRRGAGRRVIPSSSCFIATSIACGRSGSGCTGARARPIRTRSLRPSGTRSGIGSPTRCGRGTASWVPRDRPPHPVGRSHPRPRPPRRGRRPPSIDARLPGCGRWRAPRIRV